MLWGSSERFSHVANNSLVKCWSWLIIVSNDWIDLQPNKSKTDNEDKLGMLWGRSLTFS